MTKKLVLRRPDSASADGLARRFGTGEGAPFLPQPAVKEYQQLVQFGLERLLFCPLQPFGTLLTPLAAYSALAGSAFLAATVFPAQSELVMGALLAEREHSTALLLLVGRRRSR